jgi:hypothetical protein
MLKKSKIIPKTAKLNKVKTPQTILLQVFEAFKGKLMEWKE